MEAVAIADFTATSDNEISFKRGSILKVNLSFVYAPVKKRFIYTFHQHTCVFLLLFSIEVINDYFPV